MKKAFKEIAVELRKKGYSYGLIREKVPVSKSTLTSWLSGVHYSPNSYVVERIGKARAASGAAKTLKKNKTIQSAREVAQLLLGQFKERDLLMLGLGIYIGEGTKGHNIIRVINADPRIIRVTINWFQKIFAVPKKNFRIRLHLYPDNNINESLKYWSKMTRLPISQFHPVSIDRRENKKMAKRGKLKSGTAHLGVNSGGAKDLGVFLFHKIVSMIEEVTKVAGVV